ncbi:MAG: helix-turn-helix domain-containing protein [Bacteroidota bacterium]
MGKIADEVSSQLQYLEQVRLRLPAHLSLADELSEVLGVSRDSAYRRIRGETILSLDEARKLFVRYGVSLDSLFSPNSKMVPFLQTALSPQYTLMEWLGSIFENLNWARSAKESQLIFAAKDVPLFHFFRQPELAAFKLFFWQKTLLKDARLNQQVYRPDVLPKELIHKATQVWQAYSHFPSTEIWSAETITGTLKQIEFYHECGFFSQPAQSIELCNQLQALINVIKEEAAEGKKGEGGASYQLYENGILIADNTIFAKLDGRELVYISYNTTNLLTTTDPAFCQQTTTYFENLIKTSALISTSALRERNKFFNRIQEQIEQLTKKLAG